MKPSGNEPESKKSSETADEKYSNLEWINVNEYIRSIPHQEGVKDKIIRKTKENPFVPIGVLATSIVLGYGLYCMRSGQTRKSQNMMRWRIGAQGFTIGAIILGMLIGSQGKAG